MPHFRFIGLYTNGHESITAHGVTFHGNEPAEVTGEEGVRRLRGNVDFEEVDGPGTFDHDGDGRPGGSKPGRRKKKAAA